MQSKKRILIVEDDGASRRALASCLRPMYDVSLAADGAEGLDAATARPGPDLILSDVSLPGIGGLDLARHVRARVGGERIPIVFLTAYSTAGDLVAGLRAGAEHYLTKPVNIDLLLSTIEHLLRTAP